MEAKVENGQLIVTIPLQTPTPSKTGKTLVVAQTQWFEPTVAKVNGKLVYVNLNAFIKA